MKLPTLREIVGKALKKTSLFSLPREAFLPIQLRLRATTAHNSAEGSLNACFDKCVNHNYVDEHHKSAAKDRSWFHRHVARLFIWNAPLALLHGYYRRHAVLTILLRFRASGHERFFQADGRSERHSRLHSDVFEAAEPLAQSTVRDAISAS